MDLQAPPNVAGTSLSGNRPFVIDAGENAALCASTGVSPAEDGSAHPIYFFIATQVGMGMTVAELCRTCEFDVEDGPMMASSSTVFSQPLLTGRAYQVTGQILGLTRKASRKFGVVDMLEYQLNLSQDDGTPVLTTTNLWVLPRKAPG